MGAERWKINWSGGKDSTAAAIMHFNAEHECSLVCYVPMLCDGIPLIMPNHYEYIMKTADIFKSWGFKVYIVNGISYYAHVHSVTTRGENKGKYRGIGLGLGFCLFRNYSKIKALQSLKIDTDFIDIGIAADEHERFPQLQGNKRSILAENGITERKAFEICLQHDMLSPIYFSSARRDGCAICPNASVHEFQKYCMAYPAAVPVLLEIEEFCKNVRPNNAPYRNHEWFSDRLLMPYQYELNFSDI